MRHFLLLLTLLACPPAGAKEVAAVDERLSQEITVSEKGDRLSAVLERLTKKTGVTMTAMSPMQDTVVVIRYAGTLRDFHAALEAFFAVDADKGHPVHMHGSRTGDKPWIYRLMRSDITRHALETLRKERQKTLDAAMNQALQDGNQWVKHLGVLTDDERRAIYSGREVTHSFDHFGGRKFLKEVLVREEPTWSDKVSVTYGMHGHSPLTRMFTRRLEDQVRSDIVTEGWAVAQLCPQLSPEIQQKEWQLHYGDPQPQGGKELLIGPASKDPLPRRTVLLKIAEEAGVNLIADDFGQELCRAQFPNRATLSAILDAACRFQYGGGNTPDTNHGSFWRKAADTYLVRSIAWPEEEGRPSAP